MDTLPMTNRFYWAGVAAVTVVREAVSPSKFVLFDSTSSISKKNEFCFGTFW